MKKVSLFLGIILFFILQSCVFPYISLGGIIPNLLIIYISVIGFMQGESSGLIVGIICGFLCDIFYGNIIGFHGLLMMYVGFLNGKFYGLFYPEDIKLPIALIVVSDLSYGLCSYILLFLLRGHLNFGYYLSSVIIPETLYTILAAIVFYPIILKTDTLLTTFERKREQRFV